MGWPRFKRFARITPLTGVAIAIQACACLLAATPSAMAQDAPPARKQARALRIPAGALRLDGQLDESVWQSAPPLVEFVQKEPVEGAAPTETMDVRFLFDDHALYIGARMANAHHLQAPMTRRDDGDQAEYILIDLDTYLDRRTSHAFGVTASGVRLDRSHGTDDEGDYDSNFDPVWEVRTHRDDTGWTAELWLPFSQLRFNARDELVWGLNVTRWIPAIEERDYWVPVPRTESGWASRFGELRGLDGVPSSPRVELIPYVSGSVLTSHPNPANPFDDGSTGTARTGADVKLGIGPNLTLDATVNPDFGQIEADPAEVNLSAFETFFSERRPFFLEGSRLISNQSNFFYSRRIGARPAGPASGEFVQYPSTSTILGAAKLTGRTKSGASIGTLGAVTGEEFARTANGNALSRTRVAPRTGYAAGRFQQEIGTQGSVLGVEMTELHRDLPDGDPLADLLVRNAVSGGADALLRFDGGAYESRLFVGGSYIDGSAAAVEKRQRSSVRYFQRPDGPPGRFDPTRTSLGGMRMQGSLDKIAGRHWLWGANANADSPELDTNDLGRLNDAGDIGVGAFLRYRETQPGRRLRSYSHEFDVNRASDFDTSLGGNVFVSAGTNVTWHNYWSTSFRGGTDFRGQDLRLSRGGPSMGTPRRWNVGGSLGNSGASQSRWNVSGFYSGGETRDRYGEVSGNLSARPAPRLQMSLGPTYSQEFQTRQYVTTLVDGRAETYGNRYIFGAIDRSTISAQARVAFTFKPDLNLDLYLEPFAASGRYTGFGELLAPRSRDLLIYGTHGTEIERQPDGSYVVTDGSATFPLRSDDFNVRSFRSNIVLRWEWRPGSTFFVIWQQNRASNSPTGDHVGLGDLVESFSAPGDNIVAVKMTLWLSK